MEGTGAERATEEQCGDCCHWIRRRLGASFPGGTLAQGGRWSLWNYWGRAKGGKGGGGGEGEEVEKQVAGTKPRCAEADDADNDAGVITSFASTH